MINLTEEQKKKVELLDILFHTASVEELQQMADLERNVLKLKGENKKPSTFTDFVNDYNNISATTISSQMEIWNLKTDLTNIVKVLNTIMNTPVPYNQDFQTLKSKYGVY
jgi:hypothetical protein